ncbi:MAG TPA: hypothetical protein VGI10_00795 [Polyangiaceae bacterium]|jgi:hypothetical protein
MMPDEELERLIAAERAEAPAHGRAELGWERLANAVALGTPALPVASAALSAGRLTPLAKILLALAAGAGLGAGLGAVIVKGPNRIPEPAVARVAPAAPTNMPASVRPLPVAPPSAGSDSNPSEPLVRSAASTPTQAAEASSTKAEPGTSPASSSNFAAELGLIQRAKAELARGRSDLASVWLEEHAQQFPSGIFCAERDALRALVACSDGANANAQQTARRFLREHPESPLVDRVRRACKISGDPF